MNREDFEMLKQDIIYLPKVPKTLFIVIIIICLYFPVLNNLWLIATLGNKANVII